MIYRYTGDPERLLPGDIALRATYDPSALAIALHGFVGDEHVIECKAVPRDMGAFAPPMLGLTEEAAQVLMNTLWDSGLRPIEAEGRNHQVSAMQSHLDDLRAIAFHSLKLNGSK